MVTETDQLQFLISTTGNRESVLIITNVSITWNLLFSINSFRKKISTFIILKYS